MNLTASLSIFSFHFNELQECMLSILRPCLRGAASHPAVTLVDISHEKEIQDHFLLFLGT